MDPDGRIAGVSAIALGIGAGLLTSVVAPIVVEEYKLNRDAIHEEVKEAWNGIRKALSNEDPGDQPVETSLNPGPGVWV